MVLPSDLGLNAEMASASAGRGEQPATCMMRWGSAGRGEGSTSGTRGGARSAKHIDHKVTTSTVLNAVADGSRDGEVSWYFAKTLNVHFHGSLHPCLRLFGRRAGRNAARDVRRVRREVPARPFDDDQESHQSGSPSSPADRNVLVQGSDQWRPIPSPVNCQSARCSLDASRRLGNHASGTLRTRPSLKRTTSASSGKGDVDRAERQAR